jgi:hypothetical protein
MVWCAENVDQAEPFAAAFASVRVVVDRLLIPEYEFLQYRMRNNPPESRFALRFEQASRELPAYDVIGIPGDDFFAAPDTSIDRPARHDARVGTSRLAESKYDLWSGIKRLIRDDPDAPPEGMPWDGGL